MSERYNVRDESEERLVHRLEAFSDIVIGFSLAQVGLSLVVPKHATSLFDNPLWLVIYLWAFAVICGIWWQHNRLFSYLFVPTRATIILNFAYLATVGLMAYFVEVYGRAASSLASSPSISLIDVSAAFSAYVALAAINFGIGGFLWFICLRLRGPHLPEHLYRRSVRSAVINACFVAAVIVIWVGTALAQILPLYTLGWTFLVGFGGGRFVARYVSDRVPIPQAAS